MSESIEFLKDKLMQAISRATQAKRMIEYNQGELKEATEESNKYQKALNELQQHPETKSLLIEHSA